MGSCLRVVTQTSWYAHTCYFKSAKSGDIMIYLTGEWCINDRNLCIISLLALCIHVICDLIYFSVSVNVKRLRLCQVTKVS